MNQIISTPAAPAAIGPYSQAVQAGGLLFLSGTMPIDPVTGALAEPQIAAQAEQDDDPKDVAAGIVSQGKAAAVITTATSIVTSAAIVVTSASIVTSTVSSS